MEKKMSRIDENLLRKRCEHNEGEIGTLEELSLHQEDLEKLEHLQHWCKDLKILLLHSNLIPKIENIGKLKKLEYINFSLNNIERIENLEGCESLNKIDFTLNFIGELTSVENLKANIFLETLYLNGNPCTDYKGYRDFVIATLPQLKELDGREITRTERIIALRNIDKIKNDIIKQQNQYKEKRETQKKEYKNGIIEEFDQDKIEEYWSEKSENTPEVRREIAINSRKAREKGTKEVKIEKRAIKLFDKDGRPLNVNQAKIPFMLTEDEENNQYVLDVAVYKYLDTNLLDVDIDAKYVRVKIKEKLFQITLMEEVSPDKSKAQRSQTTGHLVITMPKANEYVRKPKLKGNTTKESNQLPAKNEYLEFETKEDMDFSKIVERSDTKKNAQSEYIDESEIPPLEDII